MFSVSSKTTPQMRFAKDNDLIKAFAPTTGPLADAG
jgi:hypothetical protein